MHGAILAENSVQTGVKEAPNFLCHTEFQRYCTRIDLAILLLHIIAGPARNTGAQDSNKFTLSQIPRCRWKKLHSVN